MTRSPQAKYALVFFLLAAVGWVSYARFYASPVNTLEARLVEIKRQTAEYKKYTPEIAKINRARRALESSVLAVRLDEFEHLLRTRLSGLAAEAGLVDVVVSHGQPDPVMSPILSVRLSQSAFKGPFRSEPDFYSVKGKLSARGTAETVSTAIALLQSQPWVHQIQSIKVTPVGKQRRAMQLDLGFAVLFSPKAALSEGHSPDQALVSPELLASAMALASRPVFRPPDPVPEPPVATTQPTKPASAPKVPQDAYWRVTGIITEPTPEVWMVHATSDKQRVLKLGDRILNATVVGVHHDHAQFMVEDTRYRVPLGRSLADRQPIKDKEQSE